MAFLWVVIIMISILGVVAAIVSRNQDIPSDKEQENNISQSNNGCCGMHMTCEKDSLLSAVSPSIIYYDDEDLDIYKGHTSDGYSDSEIEEFRDVLETLKDDDVAGWIRSLQNRGINIPQELLPDIFLIVGENRDIHSQI